MTKWEIWVCHQFYYGTVNHKIFWNAPLDTLIYSLQITNWHWTPITHPSYLKWIITARKTKFAKVMFLHVPVIPVHRGGGGNVCLSACWDTIPPPDQTPLGAGTPLREGLFWKVLKWPWNWQREIFQKWSSLLTRVHLHHIGTDVDILDYTWHCTQCIIKLGPA